MEMRVVIRIVIITGVGFVRKTFINYTISLVMLEGRLVDDV